jgi:hypothetical protein
LAANFANVNVTLIWHGSVCIEVHFNGAMAFSIMTLGITKPGITTLSIITLSITILSIMTLSKMTLSIMTLRIITFSIKLIFVILSINAAQHRRHLA